MANQPETPVYDAGVYQLELADPVQGGVGGVSNAPLLGLARRTAYLKQHMDALESSAAGFATLNSPALTGTPTTPTPALGDATQKIPSTDWVQKSIGGILSKSVAGASNVSLTTVEAGNGIFLFTGVITANIAVIVPTASKYWVVANRTTGSFSLTVKTAAGTGVVIPQGLAVVVYCDGTNVFLASSAGQASFTPYLFSPAAGTTSLSIANGYTPGCVMVEKNGALLRTSDYTATNGTTIVIPATVASDQFTVYAFSSFSIANVVQKSGDVMAGALALFAGSTVPTPAVGDNSTAIATTALVNALSNHGRCVLAVVSPTSLKLSPQNGNILIIGGIPRIIPSAGVIISNAGAAAATVYCVYAYMSGPSMALELSTTGHSADSATGIEIKTGDPTRTLVGLIRTDASNNFVFTSTQRFLLNWFNRKIVRGVATLTTDIIFRNTTMAEVTTLLNVEFLSWGDGDTGLIHLSGSLSNNTSGGQSDVSSYLDGAVAGNTSSCGISGTTIGRMPFVSASMMTGLSEGYHVASIFGKTSASSQTTILGSASNIIQVGG